MRISLSISMNEFSMIPSSYLRISILLHSSRLLWGTAAFCAVNQLCLPPLTLGTIAMVTKLFHLLFYVAKRIIVRLPLSPTLMNKAIALMTWSFSQYNLLVFAGLYLLVFSIIAAARIRQIFCSHWRARLFGASIESAQSRLSVQNATTLFLLSVGIVLTMAWTFVGELSQVLCTIGAVLCLYEALVQVIFQDRIPEPRLNVYFPLGIHLWFNGVVQIIRYACFGNFELFLSVMSVCLLQTSAVILLNSIVNTEAPVEGLRSFFFVPESAMNIKNMALLLIPPLKELVVVISFLKNLLLGVVPFVLRWFRLHALQGLRLAWDGRVLLILLSIGFFYPVAVSVALLSLLLFVFCKNDWDKKCNPIIESVHLLRHFIKNPFAFHNLFTYSTSLLHLKKLLKFTSYNQNRSHLPPEYISLENLTNLHD